MPKNNFQVLNFPLQTPYEAGLVLREIVSYGLNGRDKKWRCILIDRLLVLKRPDLLVDYIVKLADHGLFMRAFGFVRIKRFVKSLILHGTPNDALRVLCVMHGHEEFVSLRIDLIKKSLRQPVAKWVIDYRWDDVKVRDQERAILIASVKKTKNPVFIRQIVHPRFGRIAPEQEVEVIQLLEKFTPPPA